MKRVVFSLVFLAVSLFAKADFSEMSTEELLAMMGYVPAKDKKSLEKELKDRYPNMSAGEKKVYLKNLNKKK